MLSYAEFEYYMNIIKNQNGSTFDIALEEIELHMTEKNTFWTSEVNVILSFVLKTIKRFEDENGESGQSMIDENPTPDVRFESSATKEEVYRAIGELPEGPRQVLLLRIEAEMTFREIAEELRIPQGTALTWMRTATLQLKKALGGIA